MENERSYLAELVRQYQNGNQNAFNEIYEIAFGKAYFTALKICKNEDDAEDVMQEAFIYFSIKASEMKNPEAFMSWFNTLVASKAKDLLRKKNPMLFKTDEEEHFVIDSIEDEDGDYHPGEDVEQSELQRDVMELVDGLNDEKRTAVILFYYDKMTTREIAESLGVNENTIKSRLVQAKKDLAKGVEGLKKKNKSLYSIAPMPLIIWALRATSDATRKAFVASGKAASALTSVTSAMGRTAATGAVSTSGTTGAAAASKTAAGAVAKKAGFSIGQKIVAGILAAGIATGGAFGIKKFIDKNKSEDARNNVSSSSEDTASLNENDSVLAKKSGSIKEKVPYYLKQANSISVGMFHIVGLKSNGTVVAVRSNAFGQCDVESWTDIIAVDAGWYHTVGLKSDGTVVAIGQNYYGQCNVESWTDIVAVSAGSHHTVGLKSDGTVVATEYMGDKEYYHGQCDVDGWTDIIAVSAGYEYTVGLKSDGTVVAVGYNECGECDVESWTDIVAVSAGDCYTVGLKSDGTVVAVGSNSYGQCDVESWTDIVAVSAGYLHTVGLKSDGTVVAVGFNDYGDCDVSDWTDIIAVSSCGSFVVGLKSDGTLAGIGVNSGEWDLSDWKDIKIVK